MTSKLIIIGHDVEEEGLHVVVERLGPQEKLGKKAEILTINRVFPAVDFEERMFSVTIDLITRRVLGRAFQL